MISTIFYQFFKQKGWLHFLGTVALIYALTFFIQDWTIIKSMGDSSFPKIIVYFVGGWFINFMIDRAEQRYFGAMENYITYDQVFGAIAAPLVLLVPHSGIALLACGIVLMVCIIEVGLEIIRYKKQK